MVGFYKLNKELIVIGVMRFIVFGIVVAGVLCGSHSDASARNSLKFDGFTANVNDILSGVATYCQRNPGKMAFAASVTSFRDELFRKACGKGLFRSKLPFGDWGVFYSEADYPDGHKSVFGVGKQFTYGGREYLLVIGEEMFVRFAGQDREERTIQPAALLNVRGGEPAGWSEVINYVASDGRRWNVREGSLSDFSVATKLPDENVHAIWQRMIAADFGRLVRDMKDMNWPH